MSNAGGAGGRALGAVWRVWQGRTGAAKASGACPHPARLNAPEGNSRKTADGFPEDPTRLPEFYDGTFAYLKSLGLEEI